MVRADRYEYSTGITASVRRIEQRDFLEVALILWRDVTASAHVLFRSARAASGSVGHQILCSAKLASEDVGFCKTRVPPGRSFKMNGEEE